MDRRKHKTSGKRAIVQKTQETNLPILVVEETIETESNGIVARLKVISMPECSCKGYEGQDYFCKMHEAKVECPKCQCIDAEKEMANPMPSIKNYHCSICGIFYLRNIENGDYQF